MSKKKKKILKILLVIFTVFTIGLFALNWFLTHRLEGILRDTMHDKVSDATNGFYDITFDNLSVGLFTGELTITGLDIRPDSTTFKKWAEADTLPDLYFKINIDTIDFKGINLTWRINYQKLHFDLFEIKTPTVEIVSPYIQDNDQDKDSTKIRNSKSLYELVSPYFNVVSVKKLNLEHATVSYQMADSIIPSVYGLQDVSFHAYGFWLDENSSESGKLLYFDNFDFTTNQPQKLLENNQFRLTTKELSLNTQDSLIRIQGVELTPRRELWDSTGNWPGNFIKANVPALIVKGAAFHREKGKSYFDASLFNLLSSDIHYYRIDTITQKEVKDKGQKVTFNNWSLYDVISPVLNGVEIENIKIEETTFAYTSVSDDGVDSYNLNKFNFWANKFLIDRVNDVNAANLYSSSFGFNAVDLVGEMQTKNHRFNVDKVYLNTAEGSFFIKGAEVEPISTEKKFDYISGVIDSVSITGLNTDKEFMAERLMIKKPDVKYVRNYSAKRAKTTSDDIHNNEYEYEHTGPTSIDIATSIMKQYYIKEILLDSANFVYEYTKPGIKTHPLKIQNFNFFALDFLINDYTRQNIDWYFTCSDMGFDLKSFDNYILDDTHHLSAKDISFTGFNGSLSLKDVKLIPQENSWRKAPDKYFTLITPLIRLDGIDYKDKTVKVSDFKLLSPKIKFVNETNPSTSKPNKNKSKPSVVVVDNVIIDNIITDKIDMEYTDKVSASHFHTLTDKLNIRNISWDLLNTKELRIKEIGITSPKVDYLSNNNKNEHSVNKNNPTPRQNDEALNSLKIDKLTVTNALLNSMTGSNKVEFTLDKIEFSGLDWRLKGNNKHFTLNGADIVSPNVLMDIYTQVDTSKVADKKEKDIYELLHSFSDKITVKKFNLIDANADYWYSTNLADRSNQKINNLSLGFVDLIIDNLQKKTSLGDLSFFTDNLSFPISNGFYTIKLDSIRLKPNGEELRLDNLQMISRYPKMEFSIHHPKHQDWFGLKMNSAKIRGINIPQFVSTHQLDIKNVEVKDVLLENFKNQKLERQHNLMPMIYEGLQKVPFKYTAHEFNVYNFSVIYEELAKKGTIPGKIFFTEMNGHLTDVTNIVSRPNQFIKLEADGKLMGSGYFTAIWQVPVDSLNDRFLLDAHLHPFDLKELNQIITPLAPGEIRSGTMNSNYISMDATSWGGQIKMEFLYNDLEVDLLKDKDGEMVVNKFPTTLANWVVRNNNPRKQGKKPKTVDIYVDRDPYHSTFNYLLQLIQPAMTESVGISYGTQKFVKGIPEFMKKMRNFFWPVPEDYQEKDNRKK